MTIFLAIYAAILSTLWPALWLYRYFKKRKIVTQLSFDRDWAKKEADARIEITNNASKVLNVTRIGIMTKGRGSGKLLRVRTVRYINCGRLFMPYVGMSENQLSFPITLEPKQTAINAVPFFEFLNFVNSVSRGLTVIRCFFEDEKESRYLSNRIKGDTSIWRTICVQDPPPGLINPATGKTYHEEQCSGIDAIE